MHSVVTFFVLLFLSGSFFNSFSQATARKCVLKTMVGDVKIRRGGSVEWISARPKMVLREKDAVRTFIESEAELETSEGSMIKVGENSTLELARYREKEDAQSTTLKIMNGKLLSNVKKLVNTNSTFEFETPTATAAIRGTLVGLDVSKEHTQIKVYTGKVFVVPQGAQQGTEITENQMATVVKGQNEVTVEKLDEKPPVLLESLQTDSSAVDSALSDSSLIDSSVIKEQHLDTIPEGSSLEDSETDSSETASVTAPLKLTISAPIDGAVVSPSSLIPVRGTVSPVNAEVTINGKRQPVGSGGIFSANITAPSSLGEREMVISAQHNGSVQTITRKITVKPLVLEFSVTSPRDGQVFSTPSIQVTGTVTSGAEVTAMSISIPVMGQSALATFSGQVPVANEEGELFLEIEASLDGKAQKITRRVIYRPEYRFILSTPQDRQIVSNTQIQIRGEVLPANAEVTLQGKKLSVSSTGLFSGYTIIPDEEGDVQLEFEIATGSLSKTEMRTVTYKRPPDIIRPVVQGVMPVVAQYPKLVFTVTDRTIDEEITFYYEINGSRESETGYPNSPFYLPLLEGSHTYTVYAIDKAGNPSSKLTQKISYMGTSVWYIKLRSPTGDAVVKLPPSTPDGAHKPRYTIEFSIENLPDDNVQLMREVAVTNSSTGETNRQRTFTDNYFQFDLGIIHRASNQIIIEALDINNTRKTQRIQVHVR